MKANSRIAAACLVGLLLFGASPAFAADDKTPDPAKAGEESKGGESKGESSEGGAEEGESSDGESSGGESTEGESSGGGEGGADAAPAASGGGDAEVMSHGAGRPGWSPTGYVGPYAPLEADPKADAVKRKNRWLVPFPTWNRYSAFRGEPDATGWTYEYPFTRGQILDPYQQNILKGDYPVFGDEYFFVLTAISDTIFETRSAPTPRGIPSRNATAEEFFGNRDDFRQDFFAQTFLVSFELFKGDTAFKPRDWEIRFTPVLNINYLHLQEFNNVNIDVRDERDRLDSHVGIQELFFDYHLGDVSPKYDFITLRAGIQGFVSDFRGFLYSEQQPGVRLTGTYFSNRLQWNLSWWHFLEKDTNSGLNKLEDRRQDVFIANLIFQDAFKELLDEDLGESFTLLLSYHMNYDHGDTHTDDNGFIVRPGRFGRSSGAGPAEQHDIYAHYLGIAGEGHIGRFNLTFEYFYVFGRDTNNPIAGRPVDISAHFLMVEPSVDFDWVRLKGNFMYASGDPDPESSKATGFDTIVDNPNFAGSEDSFFQRQSLVLPQTTVLLNQRFSLLPSLRTAKNEGQANFVNPGLILVGGGIDMNISPKLRAEFNVNYLQFDRPESMELLVFQREVDEDFGWDFNLGVQYRPLTTDNVIINGGAALFMGEEGFKDLYDVDTNWLNSYFVELVLVY